MLDGSMQGPLFSIAERQPGDGFYPPESDIDGAFCWTRPRFSLQRARGSRYLALYLSRPDSTSQLRLTDDRRIATRVSLAAGWHWYSLDLGSALRETVECNVDAPLDRSNGIAPRGVMIRAMAWHNSSRRHARIERARANAIMNEQEYQSGAVVMQSVPPYLRLTMEIRCNIANDKPCVYCAWKWMKNQEVGSPSANVAFIRALEPYLSVAKVVNDSSYGEPPLHPEFAEIVDLISTDERAFSFASNGKTLRRKVRRALLGRNEARLPLAGSRPTMSATQSRCQIASGPTTVDKAE
jgi:hypothetical protein